MDGVGADVVDHQDGGFIEALLDAGGVLLGVGVEQLAGVVDQSGRVEELVEVGVVAGADIEGAHGYGGSGGERR